MKNKITSHYHESIRVLKGLNVHLPKIKKISDILIKKIKSKKKSMFMEMVDHMLIVLILLEN